ncbi:FAD/NAD(P)-binding protein [Chamaesiphon sp. VAR_48_metabat_135_sub]|uniref:FAD/NAD(P)-binding protein n=1 Tax=Chamaesiphon sp. VAR_48_metabat_135_sub TaxID=2964699 RepID=UPI00286BA183|nr:FAD/NAD(P)-binding protein [Chamaesiphon sp. VAR_48_metabat_135_sub]
MINKDKNIYIIAMMKDLGLIATIESPSTELQLEKSYDLAIIGAGISSAYTLIHYISLLEQRAATGKTYQPVKIIVTEKSAEFWTGIPYGSKSGRNALLIAPLKEFIPQQQEREHFIGWLNENRDRVFDPQAYNKGELSRKWLQANQVEMDLGLWDDLFIPRHVFGLYLKQRMSGILATATATGLIEIDLVTSEVLDVRRSEDIYRIDLALADASHVHFSASKLVLAIGSPPNVAFEQARSHDAERDICYIDNMYEPSLDFNIDRICKSLAQFEPQSPRQILIVGSNAGTLDTLYSLNNSKTLTNLVDKFVIVSPNAAFPHRINREVVQINYSPEHLIDLVKSESFTAKQIFAAVQQDVAAATARNINISDIYLDISNVVMQGLNQLSFSEQKQFVSRYAVEIGKLQRRAGGEYLDVVDDSIAQNKLEFLKGKFVKYFPLPTGGAGCEYIDGEDGQQKVFDAPIGVIINCAGFQDVTKSSSVLIQNLIRREICIPNESNRGFVIDKDFEASKNCYLMGPLVAGNIDGNFKVWHAESCQRIISLSQHLATVLLSSK